MLLADFPMLGNDIESGTGSCTCTATQNELSPSLSTSAPISVKDELAVVPQAIKDNSSRHLYDGGRGGWSCVFGAWFALFATFGYLNSLGLFQTYYEQTLLSSFAPWQISWIFTVQLFLMWTGAAIFGQIIDRFGTHHVAIPCAILCTFSIGMLSICTEYYQIMLTQGVGFGMAASGLFACAMTSTGQWFHARKALALGVVLSGSGAGGIIHSLYLNILITKVGFASAVRWSTLVIGISSIIACSFMRSPVSRNQRDSTWTFTLTLIDFKLFKQRTFAVYSIGTFFVVWGLFAPWNYLPSMSLRHEFSYDLAIYTVVVLNSGSVVGRIIPAYLADRFGRFTSVTVVALCTSILLLAFWLPLEISSSTHTQIFAFSACYGFASGGFISLMMPCAADMGPVETTGRRFGTYQVVVGFASLTSLPIQGALIPHAQGGFRHLIIFSGVTMLLGTVFIGAAAILRRKRPVHR